MKLILFDQNVPRGLAGRLEGHAVRTAASLGWEELTNGDLLAAAANAGFEILLTADKNIVYQQNIKSRTIGLIVLSTNHWPTLRANAALILEAVNAISPSGFESVDCVPLT